MVAQIWHIPSLGAVHAVPRHSTGIDNDLFVPQQTTGVIRGVPQACNVLRFPSTSIISGQNWEGHWQGPALAGQVYLW